MEITYLLSSRQKKELLVRQQEIVLALPVPPVEIADPIDWARSVLPSELRPLVAAAEEAEVRVRPRPGNVGVPPPNLTDLLGSIEPEGNGPQWTVAHVAVLVSLRPAGRVLGRRPVPQWPANVVIDGIKLVGGGNDPLPADK